MDRIRTKNLFNENILNQIKNNNIFKELKEKLSSITRTIESFAFYQKPILINNNNGIKNMDIGMEEPFGKNILEGQTILVAMFHH